VDKVRSVAIFACNRPGRTIESPAMPGRHHEKIVMVVRDKVGASFLALRGQFERSRAHSRVIT
jgi:hypothetical protein